MWQCSCDRVFILFSQTGFQTRFYPLPLGHIFFSLFRDVIVAPQIPGQNRSNRFDRFCPRLTHITTHKTVRSLNFQFFKKVYCIEIYNYSHILYQPTHFIKKEENRLTLTTTTTTTTSFICMTITRSELRGASIYTISLSQPLRVSCYF